LEHLGMRTCSTGGALRARVQLTLAVQRRT